MIEGMGYDAPSPASRSNRLAAPAESDTSTNVDGDFTATPQYRAGQAEQQLEDDHAAHSHANHVPGRWRSKYSQLEEEQRDHHRWHPQRLHGPATVSGRSCLIGGRSLSARF